MSTIALNLCSLVPLLELLWAPAEWMQDTDWSSITSVNLRNEIFDTVGDTTVSYLKKHSLYSEENRKDSVADCDTVFNCANDCILYVRSERSVHPLPCRLEILTDRRSVNLASPVRMYVDLLLSTGGLPK